MTIKLSTRLWRIFAALEIKLRKLTARVTALTNAPRVIAVRTFANVGIGSSVSYPPPGSFTNVSNFDLAIPSWPAGANYAIIDFIVTGGTSFNRTSAGDTLYAETYLLVAPIGGSGIAASLPMMPTTTIVAPNNGSLSVDFDSVGGKAIISGTNLTAARFSVYAGTIGANTNFSQKQLSIYRINGVITFMSGALPTAL